MKWWRLLVKFRQLLNGYTYKSVWKITLTLVSHMAIIHGTSTIGLKKRKFIS